MKIFLILSIFFALLIPNVVFSEEYYYIPDHKLSYVPEFCAIEFEDPQLPNASKTMYEKTESAINEWKTKLIEYTGNKEGWDFTFVKITQEEFENPFSKNICDIAIFYQREPQTEEEKELAGHTFASLGFADVTIFYLEPIFKATGETKEINGKIFEWYEPIGYANNIDPLVSDTLKHEIGHALGLDHPNFSEDDFVRNSMGKLKAPSIMVSYENLDIVDEPIHEITDYDIRAVVNLYGMDGIIEFSIWNYLDYILIGIVITIIIFIIERRRKKKQVSNKSTFI